MVPQTPTEIEPETYAFSPRELARLAIYRAAVVARFYNEELEPSSAPMSRDARRLLATRK